MRMVTPMMKTLLVSYTPRFDSNTQKLLQTFIQASSGGSELTHVDLVKEPAPLLLEQNLNALLKRNYLGEKLTTDECGALKTADGFLQQLQASDRIVIAFPMYNFSVPAGIKAWIDVIVQNGHTFKINEERQYEGLCQGKRALILMTTGSDFSQESMKPMNYATPLMQSCLGFMGIPSQAITAFGLNQYMDKADSIVNKAQQDIVDYVTQDTEW